MSRSESGSGTLQTVKQTIRNGVKMVKLYLSFLPSLRYLLQKQESSRQTVFVMIHALSGGGAERVASIVASELTARFRVVVLYFYKRQNEYPLSPGVERLYIPWARRFFDGQAVFLSKTFVRALKRRYGVYASVSFLSAMNALNAASRAKDKVICCERNNPMKKETDAKRFDEISAVYESADHVVFQSEAVRGLFSEKVRAHSSILPNPVQVTCLRSRETKHRIVTAGRLHPQKNHAMLIRAFGRFHETHPAYTLSLYGDGVLRDELKDLTASLGLQGSVILEGRSDHVHEAIADAEIFVLSSDYEGLSNALLEAMMMGFPCISTDCEGSTDVIVDGGNGLLVPRGDEDALYAALCRLADDESLRESLGEEALRTAACFRKETVAEEWAKRIAEI